MEEREEIAILHAQKLGVRAIGRALGRAPSTINRERRRNASKRTSDLGFRRFRGHRSRVHASECWRNDEPLLTVDRAEVTDR
ncbi:helix-turn-helix domain-containing protein [Synechococcus sp. CBW1107]|uniref:helix-turn-helix domain-containing protein n=1 Tax=unclassified Synechococcus TaxID=2626047 RepID=UPI0018CE1A27|nr:helix-turn-helix domain-containing protein [Synechococcus sp. CBW1107]